VLCYIINPNPHCCKAITKLIASSLKEPLLPHPLHITVGGGGFRFRYSPEDLLDKNVNYTRIIIKSSLQKMMFYGIPLNQNSFLRYFARHFWYKKKKFCEAITGIISFF
jgi:hypothetical protein